LLQANPLDSLRLELKNGKKFIVHKTVKNENLASLATRYSVDEADIIFYNPLIANGLTPGQILKIPLNLNKYGNPAIAPVEAITKSDVEKPAENKSELKENWTQLKMDVVEGVKDIKQDATKNNEEKKTEQNHDVVVNNISNQNKNAETISVDTPKKEPVVTLEGALKTPEPIVEEPQNKVYGQVIRTENIAGEDFLMYKAGKGDNLVSIANAYYSDVDEIKDINLMTDNVVKKGDLLRIPKHSPPPPPVVLAKKEPVLEPVIQRDQEPKVDLVKAEVPATKTPKTNLVKPVEPQKSAVTTKPVANSKPTVSGGNKAIVTSKTPIKGREKTKTQISRDTSLVIANVTPEFVGNSPDVKLKTTTSDKNLLARGYEVSKNINDENAHSSAGSGDIKFVHVVKEGETLESIARKYKISASDLINWNNIYNYRVRVGSDLIVNAKRANASKEELFFLSPEKLAAFDEKNSSISILGISETGYCTLDESKNYFGIEHRFAQIGALMRIENLDNFQVTYVRVTSKLINNDPKVVIRIDQATAKKIEINSPLTRVRINYAEIK